MHFKSPFINAFDNSELDDRVRETIALAKQSTHLIDLHKKKSSLEQKSSHQAPATNSSSKGEPVTENKPFHFAEITSHKTTDGSSLETRLAGARLHPFGSTKPLTTSVWSDPPLATASERDPEAPTGNDIDAIETYEEGYEFKVISSEERREQRRRRNIQAARAFRERRMRYLEQLENDQQRIKEHLAALRDSRVSSWPSVPDPLGQRFDWPDLVTFPLPVSTNDGNGCKGSRSLLPITINGQNDDALPDSMSSCNVISADFAQKFKAKVDTRKENRHVFRNACGKAFESIGTTILDVAFPGEIHKTYRQTFAVVPNCAAKLIMGNPFLKLTETLTTFKHRLRKATTWNGWRLLYMDVPTQKLGCTIDSELAFANVDSGSDRDLVSLEYASHREWDITPMPQGKGYVMLADGSVEKVAGYVDTWLSIRGRTTMKRFYVLEGLVCDVLIGDNTIDSFDIFNTYQDSFVDVDTTLGHPDCHAIKYLEELRDRVLEIVEDPKFTIPPTPTDAFLDELKEKRIIQQRGTDLLFPSRWRVKAANQAYSLISNGVWTAMERSGTAEAAARRQQESEIATLTGNELLLKQQAGDRRTQEYNDKRKRLLELKSNIEKWKQTV